jgi:hypothetical protein
VKYLNVEFQKLLFIGLGPDTRSLKDRCISGWALLEALDVTF